MYVRDLIIEVVGVCYIFVVLQRRLGQFPSKDEIGTQNRDIMHLVWGW